MLRKKLPLLLLAMLACHLLKAQFLMDMVDTTKEMGKGLLSIYKKFDRLRVNGYMQPQFQATQTKGAKNFSGGDFATNSNNRFMLRRGRVRFEYLHFAEKKGPTVQFVFQFDGTERGVVIRDFWARLLENKYQLFTLSVGMFARPFGYELNLSSSDRESPERGRMSQILMRTERDLGAMLSFEPRAQNHPLRYLKIDAGFFNGQGLTATTDFDSHKDFITKVSLKPYPLSKTVTISAAASYLNGGFLQNTKYIYKTSINTVGKTFIVDSTGSNVGKIAPRKYYGADMQLSIKNKKGVYTQLRAEYIFGTQTATISNSETPPALLTGSEGYYIRKFDGAYLCLLQNIVNEKNQVIVKYDWYDPNTKVKTDEIGRQGTSLSAADIKYSTLGFGYLRHINENLKVLFWYDKITNEKTQLPAYISDLKDNVFTCRFQFRF